MKLVLIGGHLTPALSLLDFAKKKGDEIIFIGRLQSSADHQIESREKSEVENRGGVFESLDTVKFERHKKLKSLLTFPKLITAIIKSARLLHQHKPDVIVSFGGYLAVPVAIAGKLASIPIFTHEQTRVFGLANQLIGLFASKIGLSWKDTVGINASQKVVLTGNPIRRELKKKSIKPEWVQSTKPIIYITGGSLGSSKINQLIKDILPILTRQYYCIHQCGTQTDFESLSKERTTLSQDGQSSYTVRTWFSASEVSWITQHAVFMISRSGANTVSEMIERQVPGILIPLPNAGGNEQYYNAKFLSDEKASIIIPQNELSKEILWREFEKMEKNQNEYRKNLKGIKDKQIPNPEALIYRVLKELV